MRIDSSRTDRKKSTRTSARAEQGARRVPLPPPQIWTPPTGEGPVRFGWVPGSDVAKFWPYTQAYGVCFTEDGHVVIGRRRRGWTLPGGSPEKGETALQTLERELDEELSLVVLRAKLMGAQLVEYLDGRKAPHYQLRYAVLVRLKPLTPDPDNGELWERAVVTPEEATRMVRWGPILRHMVWKAHEQYLAWKANPARWGRRLAT